MIRRFGYVAIAKSIDAPTNRTCRLRNATPERLRALIASNVANLRLVLEFNLEHSILLYRISSDLIPFGSHPINQVPWWEELREPLAAIGRFVRTNGMRVSMHPGQYTILSARDARIVTAAIDDLSWHCRLLDALGTAADAKVIVHVGATYGESKAIAIRRFASVARDLPETIRRRLIVENDERIFTAEDALEAARLAGVPVVFDWLHHRANPGSARRHAAASAVVRRCFATWRGSDGPPKVHMSSQARGRRRGTHADYVAARDVLAFLRLVPDVPFDCMLEAKAKDLALFRLRRRLAATGITEGGIRSESTKSPRAELTLPQRP
ncbi:MAG TPA: UV DNA damage repair endonuclease UvsE [Woeseiaceae bacterium]